MTSPEASEQGGTSSDERIGRALAVGAVVWLAVAVLQVLIHGITLDETATAAPIITGAIEYPPGHPHDAFYRTAFSLFHFVAAAMWLAWPDALAVSAPFNVLFLFMSAYAPFAMALALTRQPRWAWAAGALALTEAALPYDGLYPLYVYPFLFSNGHVGMHLVVLAVALLLLRRWRAGGLLLGVLPAVHGVLAMIAWAWTAWWLLAVNRPAGAERRRFLLSLGAGVGVCVALGVAILLRGAAEPLPPYIDSADPLPIYRQFTQHSDVHRQTPLLASFGYLINPLAFFLLGALIIALRRAVGGAEDLGARRLRAVLDLGAIVWAIMIGARLYRALIGPLPLPIEIGMPFRLANLTALLLVPITVAGLSALEEALDASRRWVIALVAAGALAVAAVYSLRNPPLVAEYLLLSLWGVILGAALHVRTLMVRPIALLSIAGLAGGLLLTGTGERPLLLLLLPAIAMLGTLAVAPRLTIARGAGGVALLGAAALAALLGIAIRGGYDQKGALDMSWHRMKPEDRALRSWMAAHSAPNEMILAPMWPYAKVQPKFRRPVLMEWETMYVMTYAPRHASVINAMARDLYGVNYADPRWLDGACTNGRLHLWCPEWNDDWQARSRAEWRALAGKYHFRLLMAPRDWTIDLPADTTAGSWTMYRIP